ncbi:hypothetical protein PQX77_012687 [Marasmius sp. AFHP31]|nr:hypothetical protein PQX77_012687 [Marasmius sp. AFHP31]
MAADSNHLSYLPTEIICFILEQLDPITLTHCTEVCRQLNAVVKDSHLYQYNRQLALANLEDDRSNYSNGTLARLHMLEQHQRAWNAFTWSSSRTYNLLSTHAWELAGGVLGLCDTGNVLKFNRPPSVYRGIEQEEWHFKLDELERIEDFTFDPSQNILVVLTRHASEYDFAARIENLN